MAGRALSRCGYTAGKNLLLALFDIAYHSRLGLPLLLSAGFMLFDLHLRLEVEFEANVQRGGGGDAAAAEDGQEAEDRDGNGNRRRQHD